MRRPVLVALLALVVTGAGVTAGTLLLDSDERPSGPSAFATTPLATFDTSTLTVPRASFCDAVDPRQVEAALGGEPADTASYENGDEVALADGVTDVAHEFGCAWTGAEGDQARAWVFAPPVDRGRAKRLVRDAERTEGCDASPTPPYGAPSVGLTCADSDGVRASYQGLFGDAWLTCELSAPDPGTDRAALVERAGAWCVGVALGASG
ncbi:hypothetical protein [Nocardioides sp.]|uniref:hypothetical protein n=1 Tax=Nocardioides sp. TaxID=35761 RepID=UPI001A3020F6|nr:hypothetical protein [Nocardioides sp.]MBJ7355898.1 hypothetical protein [Nocardioides sp.]